MDVFSNLMVIGECLLDTRRTKAFQRAINTVVKRGDIVADIGTGSGILAMMSAKAGAKHVFAVDIASDIEKFAKNNIKHNKLNSIISTHNADAKVFTTTTPLDVVTMELMDTWLIAEQQAVVLNNLRKSSVIDHNTKLIPYRYQCALELVSYDFSFYGFEMPFVIQARNFAVNERIQSKLSDTAIFNDIDLTTTIQTHVDKSIAVPVKSSGLCNAIVLKSKTFLAPGISVWGTTDMNMPVIIPVKPFKIRRNSTVKLHISYDMGEGFESFSSELLTL